MNGLSKFSANIKLVLKLQLVFALVMTALSYMINRSAANLLSALVGGAIAIIPTQVYVKVAFSRGLVVNPNEALRLHKKAVVSRFLLTMGLFVLVLIMYRKCNFFVAFITYIVVLSAYWFGLLGGIRNDKRI